MKINRILQEPIPKEFVKNLMKQYFFYIKSCNEYSTQTSESKAYQLVIFRFYSGRKNVTQDVNSKTRLHLCEYQFVPLNFCIPKN